MLTAIYEEDFVGFSYEFRRGRGQHDALDALVVGIKSRKVNWILDGDISSFFIAFAPACRTGDTHTLSENENFKKIKNSLTMYVYGATQVHGH